MNTSLKYMWDQKDDLEFMRMYMNFAADQANAEGEVTKRVHAIAVPYNRPDNGVVGATAFKKHIIKHVLTLKEENKSLKLSVFGLKEDEDGGYEIRGNGAFANAFKRVYNAMYYGGDLLKLQTVSQCVKFAKEAAAKELAEKTKDKLREGFTLDMMTDEKWSKVAPDDPEFQRELNTRVTRAISTRESARTDSDKDEVVTDIWTDRARLIEHALRAIALKDEATAEDMFTGFEKRLDATYEQWYKESIVTALQKTA